MRIYKVVSAVLLPALSYDLKDDEKYNSNYVTLTVILGERILKRLKINSI